MHPDKQFKMNDPDGSARARGRAAARVAAAALIVVISVGALAGAVAAARSGGPAARSSEGASRRAPEPGDAQSRRVQFLARGTRTFEGPAGDGMLMPSDVAVLSDGTVVVADGVHDRLMLFESDGGWRRELRGFGHVDFSRPLGIAAGRADRIWVADTGSSRVLSGTALGELTRAIPIGESGADITDVVLTLDERRLYVADNHLHRLLRVDLGGGTETVLGGPGVGRGQFNYPYLIAADRGGRILVSDVINGRIGVRQEDGAALPEIGSFGVMPGQLYRPKGVASDAAGRTWVSDGRLGVISVFTSDGRYIDVLRGEDGIPLRLEEPSGLAFDGQGQLYVVEVRGDRVRSFELVEREAATAGAETAAPTVGRQPQGCTVCHLEWTTPLVDGKGTELIAVPENPSSHPLVSREENCLSCHDGSVADSRRRVWVEHGHGTGITPPAGMTVPAELPLADGQIVCRTCHSAHTRGGSGNALKDAVFLRVKSDAGELCLGCHADLAGGAVTGMHPVGGFEDPLSHVLRAAGAKAPADGAAGACLTCHTPHGSAQTALMIETATAEALCIECHADVTSQHAVEGVTGARHPLSGELGAGQREALLGADVRPRWAGGLECLSCHKMHHAPSKDHLLIQPTEDGAFCLTCHPSQRAVIGTGHDLRSSAPEETNAAGLTAGASGPCAACHGVHAPARLSGGPADPANPAQPTRDADEACLTCHRTGGCAKVAAEFRHPRAVPGDRLAGLLSALSRHPAGGAGDGGERAAEVEEDQAEAAQMRCTHCHDPHDATHAAYLRAEADVLCAACHADQAGMLGGRHDFRDDPHLVAGRGQSAEVTGACGFCHAVHGGASPALWAATASVPKDAEGLCLECHRAGGLGAASVAPHSAHPTGVSSLAGETGRFSSAMITSGLPLFCESGLRDPGGGVTCATCHDPHADASVGTAMLRTNAGSDATDLCLRCHPHTQGLSFSAHGRELAKYAPETTCGPCHAVHPSEAIAGEGMWVGLKGEAGHGAGDLAAGETCTGCHKPGGTAKAAGRAGHPRFLMANTVAADHPAYMPLRDAQGQLSSRGEMTCVTCHLPHGGLTAEEAGPLLVADPSGRLLSGAKPLLRSYVAPNLCTQCHGSEGLRRFLDFHR